MGDGRPACRPIKLLRVMLHWFSGTVTLTLYKPSHFQQKDKNQVHDAHEQNLQLKLVQAKQLWCF